MKRTLASAVAVAMVLAGGSAYAMQRGNGGGPKTKTMAPAAKAGGAPKRHGQGGSKAQGGPRAHSGPKATPGGAKVKAAPSGPKARTTTGGTLALTPVQQKLQRNTNLASKLEGRLPKGTDLMLAAEGFRNLGQFVAAVNVSNNLGIPFTDLKTRMVDDGLSLGQAIQKERPSADVTTEVRRAERDADRIIITTEAPRKKSKGQ